MRKMSVVKTDIQTGESSETSILDINGGVVREYVDREFAIVSANMLDPNTDTKAKRSLTIKLEFVPNSNRDMIGMKIHVTSKLAPVSPYESSLLIGGDMERPVVSEMTCQVPGQVNLSGEEAPEANVIHIPNREQA